MHDFTSQRLQCRHHRPQQVHPNRPILLCLWCLHSLPGWLCVGLCEWGLCSMRSRNIIGQGWRRHWNMRRLHRYSPQLRYSTPNQWYCNSTDSIPDRRRSLLAPDPTSTTWYGCTSRTYSAASPTYKRCVVCNEGYYVTATGLCEVCTSPEDDELCAALTCPSGSYFDPTTAQCQTCTACTGGSGVQTECQSEGNAFTDTVCAVCTGKPENCATAEANSCVLNTSTRKCAKCDVPYELQTNSGNAGLCWACLDGEALNSDGICESCTIIPDNCALAPATFPEDGAACISDTFPTTKVCLECDEGFYLKDGSCIACTTCSAGEYVSSQCTATTDAVCMACKSKCSSGSYMSGTCSGSDSTDTIECKTCLNEACDTGYYISTFCTGKTTEDEFACTRCKTSCPTGKYLEEKCSGSTYADTNECKPIACSAGFYLKGGSCVPCSSCSAGEYISSQCSASADTVCKACKSSCSSGHYMSGTCSGSGFTDTIKCKACLNDTCQSGYYISKHCTGLTTKDEFGCSKCKTSCSTGQYLEGQCSGSTYADNTKCKACKAQTLCASKQSFRVCVAGETVLKCNKCKKKAFLNKATGVCGPSPEYIVVEKPVPVPVPVPARNVCSGVMNYRRCSIPGSKAQAACFNGSCIQVAFLGGKQRCNSRDVCGKGVVCSKKNDCLSKVCTEGACAPSDYSKKCMRTSDCQTTLRCKKGRCLN